MGVERWRLNSTTDAGRATRPRRRRATRTDQRPPSLVRSAVPPRKSISRPRRHSCIRSSSSLIHITPPIRYLANLPLASNRTRTLSSVARTLQKGARRGRSDIEETPRDRRQHSTAELACFPSLLLINKVVHIDHSYSIYLTTGPYQLPCTCRPGPLRCPEVDPLLLPPRLGAGHLPLWPFSLGILRLRFPAAEPTAGASILLSVLRSSVYSSPLFCDPAAGLV